MKQALADLITRREALRRAAYVFGGAISAPTVAAVLAGCEVPARSASTWAPQTLSREQDDLVLLLGEYILPETDTAGARAARVNEFIDAMLTDFYPAEAREHFLAGLERVDARARRIFGNSFTGLSQQQQRGLVEALNGAAFEGGGAAAATGIWNEEWHPADVGSSSFFATLKQLVLVGYYTSEVGATEELRMMPMIGPWRADIPYQEVGRSWS